MEERFTFQGRGDIAVALILFGNLIDVLEIPELCSVSSAYRGKGHQFIEQLISFTFFQPPTKPVGHTETLNLSKPEPN